MKLNRLRARTVAAHMHLDSRVGSPSAEAI